jgi:hypothetical protein
VNFLRVRPLAQEDGQNLDLVPAHARKGSFRFNGLVVVSIKDARGEAVWAFAMANQ